MTAQEWSVSTQKDEGFMLNLRRSSSRRYWIPVLELFNKVTRHRLFYTNWMQAFMIWIDAKDVEVLRIPVTWAQVQVLNPGAFDWSMHARDERFVRDRWPLGVSLTREVVVDTVTGRWASFVDAVYADWVARDLNAGGADVYVWQEPEGDRQTSKHAIGR